MSIWLRVPGVVVGMGLTLGGGWLFIMACALSPSGRARDYGWQVRHLWPFFAAFLGGILLLGLCGA